LSDNRIQSTAPSRPVWVDSPLPEPVTASADWIAAAAPWTCRGEDGDRCDWYHGAWQYLRLMDVVSNPGWHSRFFIEAMRAHAAPSGPTRVLVSGSADYSMYAHALAALGEQLDCDVLDWCPTPLAASAWYARHSLATPPALICGDAGQHAPDGEYAVIVSDSFLPRFAPDALNTLLRAWRRALSDGGAAVTTARIHTPESGSAGARGTPATDWAPTALDSRRWWTAVSSVPVDVVADLASTFAARQERNAVYAQEELEELFRRAGFEEVSCEVVDIYGKQFARVIAR